MPLYEYECEDCHKTVEVIQKFSDPPLSECEDCGGELHRLLSAPAIQFKGSGWYITDYSRKHSSKNSSGEASDSSKSDSGKKATESSGSEKKSASSDD